VRICFLDYDREIALVVSARGAGGAPGPVVAVGRLSRDRVESPDGQVEAEFSLLVSDPWQGRGVGGELLSRLVEVGRREGVARIWADVLLENVRMQRLCARLGFVMGEPDGGVVRATLDVRARSA
jgi:acetyltransferase